MKVLSQRDGRILVGILLGGSVGCIVMALRPGRAHAEYDLTTPAQRQVYSQSVAQHYNTRFGTDHPFLPSLATTDTAEFINSKAFPTAKYCGHCHQEAHTDCPQSPPPNSSPTPSHPKTPTPPPPPTPPIL